MDKFIPAIEKIVGAKIIQDIKELKTTNIETYSARSIVPIPPFLLETIGSTIRASTGEIEVIFSETIREIRRFDEQLEASKYQVEKTEDSCGGLRQWIFLSMKNKIKLITILGCCEEKVQNYYK